MNLIAFFKAGGLFMYFILVFALLTASFIVERAYSLYLKYKEAPKDLRLRLLEHVKKGDWKAAEQLLAYEAKGTGLGNVALVGLKIRSSGGGEEEIQARMDEALTREIARVDRRTGFLAMFGNVSTLLGLLGTVAGMIVSFASVSQASPAERAVVLGQGIAEALNATAFGLISAIPALLAFSIFQNRTERIITELTNQASQIYHDFIFYTEPAQEKIQGSSIRGTNNHTQVSM